VAIAQEGLLSSRWDENVTATPKGGSETGPSRTLLRVKAETLLHEDAVRPNGCSCERGFRSWWAVPTQSAHRVTWLVELVFRAVYREFAQTWALDGENNGDVLKIDSGLQGIKYVQSWRQIRRVKVAWMVGVT